MVQMPTVEAVEDLTGLAFPGSMTSGAGSARVHIPVCERGPAVPMAAPNFKGIPGLCVQPSVPHNSNLTSRCLPSCPIF